MSSLSFPLALFSGGSGSVSGDITSTTYDTDLNLTSITEAGITTTMTWNADGTVDTVTSGGITRTAVYAADGTLTTFME